MGSSSSAVLRRRRCWVRRCGGRPLRPPGPPRVPPVGGPDEGPAREPPKGALGLCPNPPGRAPPKLAPPRDGPLERADSGRGEKPVGRKAPGLWARGGRLGCVGALRLTPGGGGIGRPVDERGGPPGGGFMTRPLGLRGGRTWPDTGGSLSGKLRDPEGGRWASPPTEGRPAAGTGRTGWARTCSVSSLAGRERTTRRAGADATSAAGATKSSASTEGAVGSRFSATSGARVDIGALTASSG